MHDPDDIDFAMLLNLPSRPGPCKAAETPERDPVEARLQREVEAAPFVARAVVAVEVKHGSGKVKV